MRCCCHLLQNKATCSAGEKLDELTLEESKRQTRGTLFVMDIDGKARYVIEFY